MCLKKAQGKVACSHVFAPRMCLAEVDQVSRAVRMVDTSATLLENTHLMFGEIWATQQQFDTCEFV